MCYQESVRVLVNAEVVRVEFVKATEDPTTSLVDVTNAEVQHDQYNGIMYIPYLPVNSHGYYKFQVEIGVMTEIFILKLRVRYNCMVFNLVLRGNYLSAVAT